MNNYYEILGLEQGADKKSIKKAYFSLVRQYSPETAPEMFKKIREAYEALSRDDEDADRIAISFAAPSEGMGFYYSNLINSCMNEGDFKKAMDLAETAYDSFPEEDFFVYSMFISQRNCGKSGKAVKSARILYERHPDNKEIVRIYADSLFARGYYKKALPVYIEAGGMDYKNFGFTFNFAECSLYNRRYDLAWEALLPYTGSDYKWKPENIEEALEIFDMLITSAMHYPKGDINLALTRYGDFIDNNKRLVRNSVIDISERLAGVEYGGRYSFENIPHIRRIFDILKSSCPRSDRDILEEHWGYMCSILIESDSRIDNIFVDAVPIMLGYDTMKAMSFGLFSIKEYEFSKRDAILLLLKHRDELLEKEEIVKKDYPELYAALKEVYEAISSADSGEAYKNDLEKRHFKEMRLFEISRYFNLYPEELEKYRGKLISSSYPAEVYVRESPKIGRNDPCPCGSGKKYKKCCGR